MNKSQIQIISIKVPVLLSKRFSFYYMQILLQVCLSFLFFYFKDHKNIAHFSKNGLVNDENFFLKSI